MPRSTCCRLRGEPEPEETGDPIADAVEEEFRRSGGRCGARGIKRALAKRKIVASRRGIGAIMKPRSLTSCYAKAKFRPHPEKPSGAGLPNVPNRGFDGHAPHARIASGPTHVRVPGAWCCICPPIGLHNREIVGHAAGARKDADPVKAAFATVTFPLFDTDAFHPDGGPGFDNAALDEPFEVFGITRSPSRKGCPYDNAVDESANKALKAEFVYQEQFSGPYDLQVKLNDYVWWHNNERLHSTLGYMSPVEFRKAGLSL